MGRGSCKPNYQRPEPVDEAAITKICLDYFFLGGADAEAKNTPMFMMLDEENGSRHARLVEQEGHGDGVMEWLILDAEEIRLWG